MGMNAIFHVAVVLIKTKCLVVILQLRDIQGQAAWCSEQPVLSVGVPIHCRGDGLKGFFKLK